MIGDIRDYQNRNGRLVKWPTYDLFADSACRGCIALPVCMGGCAHHAMDLRQYENRCGTFRHTSHGGWRRASSGRFPSERG
ncbi:MAG: SPASM domain-containing protein [Dehalococcoidia bacterium]